MIEVEAANVRFAAVNARVLREILTEPAAVIDTESLLPLLHLAHCLSAMALIPGSETSPATVLVAVRASLARGKPRERLVHATGDATLQRVHRIDDAGWVRQLETSPFTVGRLGLEPRRFSLKGCCSTN